MAPVNNLCFYERREPINSAVCHDFYFVPFRFPTIKCDGIVILNIVIEVLYSLFFK
jgi:hypothetical protein